MSFEDVLSGIKELAKSQGFYGRLLRNINYMEQNDSVQYEKVKNEIEKQNFNDILDFILWIES